MNVYERITADIRSAMLAGETVRRDCLRGLVSEIKNRTVNAGKELTDDVVESCVRKAVKQRNDSVSQFESAGREDLAAREREELGYLESYLPKTMTPDETRSAVDLILKTVEPVRKNMGLVMKTLPKEADRKAASAYLATVLS